MFHVSAYLSDTLSTTADTDIPAVADEILTRINNHFLLRTPMDLVFVGALAATLNRARVVTPSARQVTIPFVRPINIGATWLTQQMIADYRSEPFKLPREEEIAIQMSSDIAMGNETGIAIIGLEDRRITPPPGEIYTMRGTSTTTTTADAWTELTVVWADQLAVGTYAVVGLEVIGVTEIAGRLIFEGQLFRPGCIAATTIGLQMPMMFRKGGLGEWGRFPSFLIPQVQVLNTAAVAVHTVYMDIIKVG